MILVLQALKVRLALQVQLVHKVLKEIQDRQVQLDLKVILEQLVHKDPREILGHKDPRVMLLLTLILLQNS